MASTALSIVHNQNRFLHIPNTNCHVACGPQGVLDAIVNV